MTLLRPHFFQSSSFEDLQCTRGRSPTLYGDLNPSGYARAGSTPAVRTIAYEKSPALGRASFAAEPARPDARLLDDLNDPAGARLDQHRTLVHDGVAVLARAVLGRDLVVLDALGRQHGANLDLLAVTIGRATLLNHVLAKTRPLLDTEDSSDPADHPADHAAHDAADRASRCIALFGATLDAAGNALRLSRERKSKRRQESG